MSNNIDQLKSYDFKFKKSLGQNFLFDSNITDKIVKYSLPLSNNVIEIGPGAGTLTTILSLRAIEDFSHLEITLGITINLIFVYIVLKTTNRIEKLLGISGINVLRRVFGIILMAIAIKLFKAGLV